MGRKLALIIGNSQYDDSGLARLTTADVDVRELAAVLRAPDIGQFDEVTELADQPSAIVRRSIAQFFARGKKDDLLVFYFSGHGVKDDNGQLFLAVKDTEHGLLAGTSIEAAFITALMDRSSSKRQVLILDCCHSGAFAYGAKAGSPAAVGTAPAFEGTGFGRVVLTATDSLQYAWEGDQVIGDSDKSVFTHYLLEGLKTGEADRDGDGLITIDELYDYVYEHVVNETPKQTPGKWSYKQQGEIVLARNPRPFVLAAELPLEVRALIESPLSRLRAEAIPELATLLQGRHRGIALAARNALEMLRTDDSRKVSAAAEAVLSTAPQSWLAETAPPSGAGQAIAPPPRDVEANQPAADAAAARQQQELERQERERESLERQEKQRQERERQERERQERERQELERLQQVAALIETAERAVSHQAAIDALGKALELDPANEGARQLLARHSAALEREAAEQIRRREAAEAQHRIEDLRRQEEAERAQAEKARIEKEQADRKRAEAERQRHESEQKRVDLAVGSVEPQTVVGVALTRLRTSRPLQAGLAAFVLIVGFSMFGILRPKSPPASERAASLPATAAPAPQQSPAQIAPPLQPKVEPPVQPETVPFVGPPTPSREMLARGGSDRSNQPPTGDQPRPADGRGQPPVVTATGPDAQAQIARSLVQGDRLFEARNYSGALAAYEEAVRLGSPVARERIEKTRQERAAQAQSRLTRAAGLHDTGDYDEALRAVDQALALDASTQSVSYTHLTLPTIYSV